MKYDLMEKMGVLLLANGFTVKTLTRTCFDIVARKDSRILLVKVLEDANSITKEFSEEMKKLSSYINAALLIISEKALHLLKDNIVYSRFGIYTLNFATFKNALENKYPFIKSTHAGITAKVIGNKLKKIREQEGFSLSTISKKVGVSKRMILRYEDESSEVLLNRAIRLYDIFGSKVFDKIDLFSSVFETLDSSSYITKKYNDLGFESTTTSKAPFEVIARKKKEIILTEVEKTNPQARSLARLVDADNLVIFRKKKPKEIPSVTKKEFLDFEKAEELVKFIKEY